MNPGGVSIGVQHVLPGQMRSNPNSRERQAESQPAQGGVAWLLHSDWCVLSTLPGSSYPTVSSGAAKNMPGKCVAAGKGRRELVHPLLAIFQIARAFCTRLGKPSGDAVTPGTSSPCWPAAAQFGFQDCSKRTQQVLCGACWTAYRAQPSAVEASHLHGFREALMDEEGGRLHQTPPGRFFFFFCFLSSERYAVELHAQEDLIQKTSENPVRQSLHSTSHALHVAGVA